MNLSKPEARRVCQALCEAIHSHESLIDAHQTQFAPGKHGYLKPNVVPREHRAKVARWKRDVRAWSRVLEKIRGGNGT